MHARPVHKSGRAKPIVMCAINDQLGAASWLALLRQSQQFVFSSESEKVFLGMTHETRECNFREICRRIFYGCLLEYSRNFRFVVVQI